MNQNLFTTAFTEIDDLMHRLRMKKITKLDNPVSAPDLKICHSPVMIRNVCTSSVVNCCDGLEQQRGFTLIEVLMALTVFALIAGLSYAALGTAGNGFEILSKVRLTQEKSGWVARQLRSDLRYLSAVSQAKANNVVPIRIHNDNRGDIELDELWLLVREPGLQAISQVHYFIDEDSGHLMRESRLLLARDYVEPIRWDFGKVASWSVEIWDQQGNWRQDWNFSSKAFVWPKAVRVSMKVTADDSLTGQRQWWMPVLVGSEL